MVKAIIAAFLLLLALGAGSYYYFRYPPKVLEHAAQHALDDFARAINGKDRAKISDALKMLLTDSAAIHLEIVFSSVSQINGSKPVAQDFANPATFIGFVDNVLYSLEDYHWEGHLKTFALSSDRQTASVTFTSKQWADGVSYYGGAGINMRFSGDGVCDAEVVFEGGKPRLQKASCTITLVTLPKPGEESKLRDPAALGELLR